MNAQVTYSKTDALRKTSSSHCHITSLNTYADLVLIEDLVRVLQNRVNDLNLPPSVRDRSAWV